VNVVPIHAAACRETVAALQHLLAQAQTGGVRGVAVCVLSDRGRETIAFTGVYGIDTAKAASAASRMSWRIAQLQDAMDDALP
jgi:hypothetical protein